MTVPAEQEHLLSVAEVADRLHVQVRTVRAWRRRGTGPRFFMTGQRLVTTERDLDAWLNQRR